MSLVVGWERVRVSFTRAFWWRSVIFKDPGLCESPFISMQQNPEVWQSTWSSCLFLAAFFN